MIQLKGITVVMGLSALLTTSCRFGGHGLRVTSTANTDTAHTPTIRTMVGTILITATGAAVLSLTDSTSIAGRRASRVRRAWRGR